jgi:hypothetical protein
VPRALEQRGAAAVHARRRDTIFIDPGTGANDDTVLKYVISHEHGHALVDLADPSKNWVGDSSANSGNCYSNSPSTGHDMNSMEYHSTAAIEGIAAFYAAFVWNTRAESDCMYYYPRHVDWELDGDNDMGTFNCEDSPIKTSLSVDGNDYLYDICDVQEGEDITRRSTEVDWLRFWWDMTTDQDLTLSEILDIWVGAQSYSWSEDDSGTADYQPNVRLRVSAYLEGFGDEYDDEYIWNGVDE